MDLNAILQAEIEKKRKTFAAASAPSPDAADSKSRILTVKKADVEEAARKKYLEEQARIDSEREVSSPFSDKKRVSLI